MKKLAVPMLILFLLSAGGCSGMDGQSKALPPSNEPVSQSVSAASSPEESLQSGASSVPGTSSGESASESYVSTDFHIYPDVFEVYPHISVESRVGTQEELEQVTGMLAGLKNETIRVFAADYQPSDYIGTYPLTGGDVETLVEMLGGIGLALMPPEQFGNPHNGGGSFFYIETDSIKFHLGATGYFSVNYPDSSVSLVFKEIGYTGPEPGPYAYIYQKQQGNL